MIRFFIALWAAKLADAFLKRRGGHQNDRAGFIANRLCPDFMARVKKPRLVVAVSGTNGKTSTSTMVCSMLRSRGMTVNFNEWGANTNAGYSINLLRGVSVFNRCRVDASVLEMDERSLPQCMPMLRPQYLVVTNISRDSIQHNGHPEYIFDQMDRGIALTGDGLTVILNANDPISSRLGETAGCRRVFYAMADIHTDPLENGVKEVSVCPVCGGAISYRYRHYRHIGDYRCDGCDFAPPRADYWAETADLARGTITVTEDGEAFIYPLISQTVYYAFNVLSAVALFREMGMDRQAIADFLRTQKIPKIRESVVECGGVRYYASASKGQNGSSASTVFERLVKDGAVKELVFAMDEIRDSNHPLETLTWLYESDYEFLNVPQIKKIVVFGEMCYAHRLRLLLAGYPAERIFCAEREDEVPQYVDVQVVDEVYVLFDIDSVTRGQRIRDALVKKAGEGTT